MLDILSIVTVNACVGQKPHKAILVFLYGQDTMVTQPFRHTYIFIDLPERGTSCHQEQKNTSNIEPHVDCMCVKNCFCNYELQVITPVARNCSLSSKKSVMKSE